MNPASFSLVPWPGEDHPPGFGISGTVARRADTLSIGLALRGDLSKVSIPRPEGPPSRKERLWETTCLELFLGLPGSEGYWEFHLSPAGHWNVYRFASYREAMREEPAFPSLPFGILVEPGSFRLSMDLDLGKVLPPGGPVEVGVCAVIRTETGGTSHWALAHPGPRPDFHRREGFALNLPGE